MESGRNPSASGRYVMAEPKKSQIGVNDTVGVDVDEAETSAEQSSISQRQNIPILMILQGDGQGKKFPLTDRESLIGRSPDAYIQLSDFEISRNHAKVVYENQSQKDEPPRCVLVDEGSRNGTFVNGERIKSCPLQDKDIIAIGSILAGYYVKDENEVRFDSELYSMATIDSLTGVYNKHYFQRELQRELQRALRGGAPLTLLFCDLDRFKRINDTYGHLAGDMILRKIGEILTGTHREYDICARYGGEEFAVILPSTTMRDAEFAAERLRMSVESHIFTYQEEIIRMTISVGVAALKPDMRSAEDLIKAADDALYRAKEGGRNQVA
jgi:two-component system cell cycle response regulator